MIATQNPVEYIATGHLSEALRDRFEHVALAYQSRAEEERIVRAETGCADEVPGRRSRGPGARDERAPRLQERRLGARRHCHGGHRPASWAAATAELRAAAHAALATRVDLRDDLDADLGATLDELYETVAHHVGHVHAALPPFKKGGNFSPT